jgi:BirA family biotin operon repressor/biotin-[acetyl-CoA-carboxylase] ligase
MIRAGAVMHGTAWFAREQTLGKGQWQRKWQSLKDENILMSVAIRMGTEQQKQPFQFQAQVALACLQYFNQMTGVEFQLKWPNDLMLNDRKAGGILIENIYRGNRWEWAVIGLGINVNQTSFGTLSHRAVSLKMITGLNYDLPTMAEGLREFICTYLEEYRDESIMDCRKKFESVMFKKGEEVYFIRDDIRLKAHVLGVTDEGALRVFFNDREENWQHGQVQWDQNSA